MELTEEYLEDEAVFMTPALLKSQYKVLVKDGIWYVPQGQESRGDFRFEGFSSPLFFNNEKPVYLEYCSGNGAWICHKALSRPEINWVGLERKWKRLRKINQKALNQNLDNLLGVYGEAYHVTKNYLIDQSVDAVFINFPDPWPKLRHAKHRLINHFFIEELARIMKKGALIHVVTDDIPYAESVIKLFLHARDFEPLDPCPHYITDLPGYGTSYFESLWRGMGKEIRTLRFTHK